MCDSFPNIVFSDEKLFTIQQVVNKQNDQVWLSERFKNLSSRLAARSIKPASVMVWAAVSVESRFPLVFLDPWVNATEYRVQALQGALKPWAQKQFKSTPFTLCRTLLHYTKLV